MIRRRRVAVLLAALGALGTRASYADVSSSSESSDSSDELIKSGHRSKLFVGGDIGAMAQSLRIDGMQMASDDGVYFGFHAGYARAFTKHFGVIGLMRFGDWQTSSAKVRGEDRYRIDLAVGPELQLNRQQGWHLSAPLGATIAQSQAGSSGRIVQDSFGPGTGFNFGLSGGFHTTSRHSNMYAGTYVDVAWLAHYTWFDHSARLTSTSAIVNETYRYIDHMILFTFGVSLHP